MASSLAKLIFDASKFSDIVLFLDRRPNSALDLISLFALRRFAADPTRTAVHVVSSEGRTQFWRERLRHQLQDRLFLYVAPEISLSVDEANQLIDHRQLGLAAGHSISQLITSRIVEHVLNLGSSTGHHVVIFDSISEAMEQSTANLCTLIVTLPGQIAKANGGAARTSIGVLGHCDLLDFRSERALKFISMSCLTVTMSSQNKSGQQEFVCLVDHLRHEEGNRCETEKITLSDEWTAMYGPADSVKQSRLPPPKSDAAIDPTSNLSFNLRLTTQERTARDQVSLPHVRGGSVIYYEPDEADDIDYEEPEE